MKYHRNIKIIFILIGATITINSCIFSDMCGDNLIKEISNSSNKKAVIFYRDCGATTSASIQLSIVSKDQKLDNNMTGNVLILDDGYKSAIEAKWISNDTLEIQFDKKLKSFTKEIKVAGVKIIYRKINKAQ